MKPATPDAVVKFSASEVREHLPDVARYVEARVPTARPIPDRELGAYQLPRGSVFVPMPGIMQPFAFPTNTPHGYVGRAMVVVAREWGDLAWPVQAAYQAKQARADVPSLIPAVFGDWLPETLRRRRPSRLVRV